VTDREDLGPGRWMWDDDDTIRVADDPTGRRIELGMTAHAFVGDASDVTIRGLVVEKYATSAQSGAIQAQQPGDGERGIGWLIEDVEVRLNHAAGIRTGDETIVRNTVMHHNGQMGLAVSGGTDVLIEDSEIAHNNIAGFRWGWEAGGMKATRTLRLTVRGVYSHDNMGPGLWTDIDARDTVYEGNTVQDNTGPGIFHEISYDAVIADNVVERNGFDNPDWLWGAGILVAASSGVEVHSNIVTGNADGIAGIQQDRGEGAYGPRIVSDLWVHDNEISVAEGGHTGVVQDVDDNRIFDERNNRFDNNTYIGVAGDAYAWNNRFIGRQQWVRSGQDANGVWR
jgi:parallel beta-helix repeat protein